MRIAARRFAAAWLPGCASTAALDRALIEVSSANFSIYTTFAEKEARGLLENLELFRSAPLVITQVRNPRPRVPAEIFAFPLSVDDAQFPTRRQRGRLYATRAARRIGSA